MTEIGKVKKIDEGKILIECKAMAACHACGKGSCKEKPRDLTARNSKGFPISIGDFVEVYLPSSQAIFAGFLVFIFPLALFFLVFFTGENVLGLSQGKAMLTGLIGLALGFFFSYLIARRYANLPEITRVVTLDELGRAAETCEGPREE